MCDLLSWAGQGQCVLLGAAQLGQGTFGQCFTASFHLLPVGRGCEKLSFRRWNGLECADSSLQAYKINFFKLDFLTENPKSVCLQEGSGGRTGSLSGTEDTESGAYKL